MDSRKKLKLSILMPAYNEGSTIAKIVELIDGVELEKWNITKELIIVDDGSTDHTSEIVDGLKKKYGYIKFVKHDKNSGKGAAVRTAIQNATGDIMIVQDADLEYDPQDYIKCITPILEGRAKVVYGSRRLDKNNPKWSSFSYYVGGMGINLIFNILFSTNLTDEPTCYKTFSSETIKNMEIVGNKFDWEPEVTAKLVKKGIRIHEVPIKYFPRSEKDGKKIKWKDGVDAVWTMLRYRFTG
ncbi:MAG: glycosyltransferase family 2 protein [archaeon]